MATRQQLEQQLVAAHRSGNVQQAQQAAYNIRAYDTAIARGGSGFDWSVPSVNAKPPIQQVPKPTFGSWLENVTAGIGEGLGEQVQGLGGAIQRGVTAFAQDPLKASAAAFMTAVEPWRQGLTQPTQAAKDVGTGIVETGKQMYQQATSGPIGLGQTVGQMIDLPGPSLPGGKRRPTMAELDVYHGTPHTFDPETGAPLGRFRSEKIGTGEGAQVYGHGLYLAENPEVANDYKVSLEKTNTLINGKPVLPGNPDFAAATQISVYGYDNALQKAINDSTATWLTPEGQQQQLVHAERIRSLKNAKITEEKTGRVYKVDLPDAKIEQMLDWDKPLAEQPQLLDALKRSKNKAVQSVMAQIGDTSKPIMSFGQDLGLEDGQGLMRRLSYALDGRPNSPKASALLQKLGVPGVKYLDAGSRDGGKGTRNFVVFPGEEQSLTILERDGVKAKAPEPKDLSFTDALSNLVRPDLEDDQVFSKPLPPADADNLDYVGKFGASSTGTGGMHVSVRDEVKDAGPHEFFFYDNNDEPLGFARLTKNKKQASINMIAFNEEGRGRGLGKSFYKYLLDDLDVEVKSDKEITQGTARIYESLAKEYPTRVDYDGRVVISPKYK